MNALSKDLKNVVRDYENNLRDIVNKDSHRLKFHLMPTVGWLNDPNGLCEFNGEYHVFYQYSPFNENGGIKFWGHYTSKDFINWENKGTDLFSDEPFDCHGAYSGSTLVDDGKMNIFYTGNVKNIGDYDYINDGKEQNTILIISEDGKNFDNKKLIITNKDYPSNLTCHVRDPKVFKDDDKFYMVQGARDKDDVGQVILFESDDLINWKYINTIKSEEKFGYMWECPDLISIDDKNILLISPQGVEEDGIKYNNIYQSGYYFIEGDYKSTDYKLSDFEEIDRGFDFYAPQTFKDSSGRTILIGWMGLPDIEGLYSNPTVEYKWQHALTIPRQLKVKDNRLLQSPIEELKNLRKNKKEFKNIDTLEDECYDVFETEIDFKNKINFKMVVKEGATLEYSKDTNLFSLYFDETGYGRTKRSCYLEDIKNIRVFLDTSSIEIFINDGEEVFTSRFYPENQKGIKISGENLDVKIYELDGFNIL